MIAGDAWPGLTLERPVDGGHRNEVWAATYLGARVAVRRSRRSPESLAWELDVLATVADLGIGVAAVVPTATGERHADGVVVQRWINGRQPAGASDWQAVADELARLHAATGGVAQRPGCCVVTDLRLRGQSVDADLSAMPPADRALVADVFDQWVGAPVSVVHGDPDPSNIRLDDDGRVWLLDWDESRVDVRALDLANLGVDVPEPAAQRRAAALAHAWEAANAWTTEPAYARRRLAALRSMLDGS